MKDQFSEFYKPTPTEFKTLWTQAIFVFDANVLLGLYRYPPKAQVKLLSVLKKLKNRLWIPHQVALEYHRRRIDVICAQEKTYQEMVMALSGFEEKYSTHPFLQDKGISKRITQGYQAIKDEITQLEKEKPDWLKDDTVLASIEKIFSGKVGLTYGEKKLLEIYQNGAVRYEKETPPGYKDTDKDKSDKTKIKKFGDLIIWNQIIDKAKVEKKPIIFVTDERKEDWWWQVGGRNIGARHELIKEIKEQAGIVFHMYQSDQFIEHAQEHLNTKLDKALIEQVKKIREAEAKKADDLSGAGVETSESPDVGKEVDIPKESGDTDGLVSESPIEQ